MTRLFVAIDLPEEVKDRLVPLCNGLPGARWVHDRQFHLTLRFLGEVEGPAVASVAESLRSVHAPGFELSLRGVGHFPPRGPPRVLWAGVDAGPGLFELQRQVEKLVRRAGQPPDPRKFSAHVTLARLVDPPLPRVVAFLRELAGLLAGPIRVERFQLWRSVLGREGARHAIEEAYPLETAVSGDLPGPGRLS